jgi:precorrin-6B methylase 2
VLDTLANILQITRVDVLAAVRLKTNASLKEKMHKKIAKSEKVKKLQVSEKEVFRGLKIPRSSKEAPTAMLTVHLMAPS